VVRGGCGKRGDGRSQQGRATGRRSTWLVGLHGGILVLRRWKSGLKLSKKGDPVSSLITEDDSRLFQPGATCRRYHPGKLKPMDCQN